MLVATESLTETIRCPGCLGNLEFEEVAKHEASLSCSNCNERFPITDDIPRMLLFPMRDALAGKMEAGGADVVQIKTARSFGFEWNRFPEMYREWQQSFLNYMQPHAAEFFKGKKVLDAGCGTGRFSYYAARYGAEVWAIDLGSAVDVARRNTHELGNVRVIQADLHRPPFAAESFDFIYSIGVLHHLPDPEPAFRHLLDFLKPGGNVQIYLYWKPEGQPIKRFLLGVITAFRQLTTRLPHPVVHTIAFPTAMLAFLFFVWPYQLLKRVPGFGNVAEKIPMKQYASFPFRVCVNDQFDRLSAPIENRYTRSEVEGWLKRANLENVGVYPNSGWVASGRKRQVSNSQPEALI
jgi:SAM-dependent methyltransferase/uncharacterized protein YbaR (Trm112 family)